MKKARMSTALSEAFAEAANESIFEASAADDRHTSGTRLRLQAICAERSTTAAYGRPKATYNRRCAQSRIEPLMPSKMDRANNEQHQLLQLSDRPLGIMETGRLDGHRLHRLGNRPRFVAGLGYRSVDSNLSGPLRLKESVA